ncbi:cytochrome P450 81E8-like protein, partial [Tanacetum coccineum]
MNDIIFANRPHMLVGKIICNNYSSLVSSSYGDNLRNLRKIASIGILSIHHLNEFHDIRVDEGKLLVRKLVSNSSSSVDLKLALYELTLNVMMRMVFWSWLGVNELEKKLFELAKRRKVFFQGLIEQLRKSKGVNKKKTPIEVLLWLQELDPDYHTDDMIQSFVL